MAGQEERGEGRSTRYDVVMRYGGHVYAGPRFTTRANARRWAEAEIAWLHSRRYQEVQAEIRHICPGCGTPLYSGHDHYCG